MRKLLALLLAMMMLLSAACAAAEDGQNEGSPEIAITVGDREITADELKDEVTLKLIMAALKCAEYGYGIDIVDPMTILDETDKVAFDMEMRIVIAAQAEKMGVAELTPESEAAVEEEVRETWDRYVAVAYSENGMAFLPAGDYEYIDGDPEGNLLRYFASFGLTEESLRRVISQRQVENQLKEAVVAGLDLTTEDEIIDYYSDWILEHYREAGIVRNDEVISRMMAELAADPSEDNE